MTHDNPSGPPLDGVALPDATEMLLPCPFCGGTNLKSGSYDKIVGTWCLTCEATGPNEYGSRATWNRRAPSEPAEQAAPAAKVGALAGLSARPPFSFDRYIDGVLMAEGVTIEREDALCDAMSKAARLASRGPNGEVPVLVYTPPDLTAPLPDAVGDDEIQRVLDLIEEKLCIIWMLGTRDEFAKLLREALSAARLRSSPGGGWRWVPVEPTEAMIGACVVSRQGYDIWEQARIDYAAMLDAAPSPSSKEGE
jgi:hypothetical protein